MYNYDNRVIIFTVTNWDRRTVDNCDVNPHYVLCSVDKPNLVLIYSFDDGGGGSTLLHHWVSFSKILKEKNKQQDLSEEKIKSITNMYTKVNSPYLYHIRFLY